MGTEKKTKFLSIGEAQKRAKALGIDVSEPTIRKWCLAPDFGGASLGHQLGGKGGKCFVNRKKFEEFLHGTREKNEKKAE